MQSFINEHLLRQENRQNVANWFDIYYKSQIKKKPWWELSSLFTTPPLARDWSAGYTPTLDQYSDELTLAKPHYAHLVDRETEIAQVEEILSKSQEANVVIVGEEGVGKHTIVEALAKRIFEGRINPLLAYKRIIKIDVEKILSQSEDSTQKEQIFKTLLLEAEHARNIIIFIDNFHKYISLDNGRGIDLTVAIAEFAGTKTLQFLTVTTPHEYQRNVFPNEKINRFFEKVEVSEIDSEKALAVLLSASFAYETRYNLIIPYESLYEIVEKSAFYITEIPFPEKAIELLDRSCIYAMEKMKNVKIKILTPDMVDSVLTEKTHIPVKLTEAMKAKLLNIEKYLEERIIQQTEGIEKLASSLRKSLVVSGTRTKPLASLLVLGPTGVGKTETAKALSQVFFDSEKNLVRFDMSLYQSPENISDLIGSQDRGDPGLLPSAIHQKPYGVLLLDEIEKANKDLINIFLTVLDEGYFTDGFGRRVDCKNLIIIATSNAGSDYIWSNLNANFILDENFDKQLINHLIEEKIFNPEFLNRFDGVIVYRPLDPHAIGLVAKKMLEKIGNDIYKLYQIKFTLSDSFLQELIDRGYDPKFGARNMERVIREKIEDKIARMVLAGQIARGQTIAF